MTNEQLLVAPYVPFTGDPTAHRAMHGREQAYVEHKIEGWRAAVGIAQVWAIEVHIFCTHEMPLYEGYCTWDTEKFYAEMGLCCALSVGGLEWVLLTELCELQGYREGDWVARMVETWVPPKSEGDRLLREFQFMRNQTIEERVQTLLGCRRPFSLRYQEAS